MENTQRYTALLTQVFRHLAAQQRNSCSLNIRSVCDEEAGQFLLLLTGWERSAEKLAWHDSILVDIWLHDGKVVVIENNVEDMLEELLDAGIAAADIADWEEVEVLETSVA
jgi:hypothetical protein